jgi:hypothetical protein
MNTDEKLGFFMIKLQKWYKSQCDGDWEHQFGIAIDTLDNPGWTIKIDLADTQWENVTVEPTKDYENEQDFLFYAIEDKKFDGSSSIDNFARLLEAFFEIIER